MKVVVESCLGSGNFEERLMKAKSDLFPNRLKAQEKIYLYDSKMKPQIDVQGEGLKNFMKAFDLENTDFTLKRMHVCFVVYPGPMAASICNEQIAKERLKNQREGERLTELLVLNMRQNWRVSPVGVVHGGQEWHGAWEVPETVNTIVWSGDRLVFYDPSDRKAKAYMKRLSDAESPGVTSFLIFSSYVSIDCKSSKILELLKTCVLPKRLRMQHIPGHCPRWQLSSVPRMGISQTSHRARCPQRSQSPSARPDEG